MDERKAVFYLKPDHGQRELPTMISGVSGSTVTHPEIIN
jgi:hypothetical protein